MGRDEAIKVITGYAACANAAACELCPYWPEEKQKTKRGSCVFNIGPERVQEALQLLARTEDYGEV